MSESARVEVVRFNTRLESRATIWVCSDWNLSLSKSQGSPPVHSVTTLELRLAEPIQGNEAPDLNLLFGSSFENQITAHNNGANNDRRHQYPGIQFKTVDQFAYLIGINSGSERLQELWADIDPDALGSEDFLVLDSQIATEMAAFDVTSEPITYEFLKPWIALNHKNFQEYTSSRSQAFRRDKLNRTLYGNCLGLCKSLEIQLNGYGSPRTAVLWSASRRTRAVSRP